MFDLNSQCSHPTCVFLQDPCLWDKVDCSWYSRLGWFQAFNARYLISPLKSPIQNVQLLLPFHVSEVKSSPVLCPRFKSSSWVELEFECRLGRQGPHFLFALCWLSGLQDLSSSTRDWTHAPCSGNTESWLLDYQGSPWSLHFWWLCLLLAVERLPRSETRAAFFSLYLKK